MKFYLSLLICSLSLSLFAERKSIFIPRQDGSSIEGYFDTPDSKTEVPVVVFIDGSNESSVIASHDKLASRFNPKNIGFISLEKRGISSGKIDKKTFYAHDCFQERLQDYSLLLSAIRDQKIVGCNGSVILLGGSEGGKIAPRLSLDFLVQGVVLIASGGGLSFKEEMKYQCEQLIQQQERSKKLGYKVRNLIFPKEIDKTYDKMLKKPSSLKMCGPKTWKWFASYLSYDLLSDLLKVKAPIYMVHGEQDILIPIKSADLIEKAFSHAGKTNLHYARYQDLGHALTGREDVYTPMLEWICAKSKRT